MTGSSQIHGGQLRVVSQRFGIPMRELVDFRANINPEGPPPGVFSALDACLDDVSTLTAYPDLHESDLKESIAASCGAAPENIAVANGFIPLLEAALRAASTQTCVLPAPAFIEYRKTLLRAGITITPQTLTPQAGFRYDPEALVAGREEAILLANPQNPSGVLLPHDAMLDLVARADALGIHVLIDEASIDYAPEHSMVPFIERFQRLIVFRSVTEFYAIPGLRAAYAVANSQTIQATTDALAPWPITTLASVGVRAALADEPYAIHTRILNRQRRTHLRTRIETLGIDTYPSEANFLLLRLPFGIDAAAFWERMIVDHGIVLRLCSNFEALPPGFLRAAVRNSAENERLVEACFRTLLSWGPSKA